MLKVVLLSLFALITSSFFSVSTVSAVLNHPTCNPEWRVQSVSLPDTHPKITESFPVTVTFDTTSRPDLYDYEFQLEFNNNWSPAVKISPGSNFLTFTLQAPEASGQYNINFRHTLWLTSESCDIGQVTVDNADLVMVRPISDGTPAAQGGGRQPFRVFVEVGDPSDPNGRTRVIQRRIEGNTNCAQLLLPWMVDGLCTPPTPIVKPSDVYGRITILDIQRLNPDGSVDSSVMPRFMRSQPALPVPEGAQPPYGPATNEFPIMEFSWTPRSNIGTVTLTPTIGGQSLPTQGIDKTKVVDVTALFTAPIAGQYQIVLRRQRAFGNGWFADNVIDIRCPGGKDCLALNNRTDSLEWDDNNLTKIGNDYRFTFRIKANTLNEGTNNTLSAKLPERGNEEKARIDLRVADPTQCTLQIALSKSTFANARETKQPIKITLPRNPQNEQYFASGNYKVEVNDHTSTQGPAGTFTCGDLPCEITYNLADANIQDRDNSASYMLKISDISNGNRCGRTGNPTTSLYTPDIIIQGNPIPPPGGGGGGTTQNCPAGQICTSSSGGIRCNPDNPNVDPSTGRPRPESGNGIMTAIGCVPTEPQKLIQGLFRVGIGLGGAAALLLMIGGAFQFITSAGNPDAVKSASETFTQAAIGLLVIIFAVLLLQIIGVDILNIPGFGK